MKALRRDEMSGIYLYFTFGTIVTAWLSNIRACRTLPHGNYLGILSVRRWMPPRDTELEQK
jgi:hypothetical protein